MIGLKEVWRWAATPPSRRILREAQPWYGWGSHPHIVTVFDLGEDEGQTYLVTELMGGGDVEGVLEDAEGRELGLEQAISRTRDLE